MPESMENGPIRPLSAVIFPLISTLTALIPSASIMDALIFSVSNSLVAIKVQLCATSQYFIFPEATFCLGFSVETDVCERMHRYSRLS